MSEVSKGFAGCLISCATLIGTRVAAVVGLLTAVTCTLVELSYRTCLHRLE